MVNPITNIYRAKLLKSEFRKILIMTYKKDIEEFIVENFLFGEKNGLTETTNFFDKGIVDSTGVLELICFLEETYDLTIDDEEVTQKNFSSIFNVNNFLQKKITHQN